MATPPAFSPPRYAIWVNSLWFLSLVISLSCAMLATLLQQWARRYLKVTQPPRCEPHKRARARAFFAHGIEKYHVAWAVEALPTLVHLSLFIFFAGLLVYLFNIDHTVFKVVVCWVALLTTVYGFITFMPFFWHDSPYHSPLSAPVWSLPGIISNLVLKVAEIIARHFSSRFEVSIYLLRDRCRSWFPDNLETAASGARSKRLSEIDTQILDWTANALDEDDALERFIESIPGFYKSAVVKNIPESAEDSIQGPLIAFLYRTLSSNSVSRSVKLRRLGLCLNAASKALHSVGLELMFRCIIDVNWSGPDSIEIGHFLRSWDKSGNGLFAPYIRGIIALIVACVREGDDRWSALALDHLGVPEGVRQGYLTHGDSIFLANLIHFIRHANLSEPFDLGVVETLPKFDTRNTLPELQDDFCAVWNQLVQEAQNGDAFSIPVSILERIQRHYIALHRGTDAAPTAFSYNTQAAPHDHVLWQPSSYPPCSLPDHRLHPTHQIHDVPVVETISTPAATPSAGVPCHDSVLNPIIPSSSSLLPDDITIHLADESPSHLPPAPIIRSSHPTSQVPQRDPSPATPSHSVASMSTKAIAFHPAISSAMTSDPNHSIPIANTSISQLAFPLSASSAIVATVSLSRSTVSVVSFSSSPPMLPSNAPPINSFSLPTSSSSHSNQALLVKKSLHQFNNCHFSPCWPEFLRVWTHRSAGCSDRWRT